MPEPSGEAAPADIPTRPEGLFPPAPPRTGDEQVDAALERFAEEHLGDLDARTEAGAHLQDALDARLRDVGA